jgi:hypothetical protein
VIELNSKQWIHCPRFGTIFIPIVYDPNPVCSFKSIVHVSHQVLIFVSIAQNSTQSLLFISIVHDENLDMIFMLKVHDPCHVLIVTSIGPDPSLVLNWITIVRAWIIDYGYQNGFNDSIQDYRYKSCLKAPIIDYGYENRFQGIDNRLWISKRELSLNHGLWIQKLFQGFMDYGYENCFKAWTMDYGYQDE